jgi:hypothetical protein
MFFEATACIRLSNSTVFAGDGDDNGRLRVELDQADSQSNQSVPIHPTTLIDSIEAACDNLCNKKKHAYLHVQARFMAQEETTNENP